MKAVHGVLWSSALILVTVGVALGGETNSNVSGAASSTTNSAGAVGIQGPVDAQGEMQAMQSAKAGADANASLSAIRERAKKASAKACATVQKQLSEISEKVDAQVEQKGDVVIAGRIAPEFGMSAEAMFAERSALGAGLGELMIAHTLMANSKLDVTAEQIFLLQREGLGWGQIAHGLNLKIGGVGAAVKSEYNVAAGLAKPDGKPAMIQSGTHAAASTNTGVHAGPIRAGTATSAGVGIKVGD